MNPPRVGTQEEITIGVVGADELVHRIMAVAREVANPSWRLTAAVYTREADAYHQAARIASRVDVLLFAGPLPYDVAVGAGELPVPSTYVPIGGAALYGALLQASVEGTFDPLRVSIDSVSEHDVQQAYREIGLATEGVRVQAYVEPGSAADFLRFHRELYDRGETSGAVTTVPTVASALREAGVPMLKMTPVGETLRHALHTAALMGSGAKLEESRIVTMIVRVPKRVLPEHASPSNYWYQDLRLSLHRVLLHDARPMDAAVLSFDERSYLVVTTMGSLQAATDDLSVAPFVGRVADELGLELEVGIGLGRTTREAELNARSAVDKAAATESPTAYLLGPGDTVLQLPVDRSGTTEGEGGQLDAAGGGAGLAGGAGAGGVVGARERGVGGGVGGGLGGGVGGGLGGGLGVGGAGIGIGRGGSGRGRAMVRAAQNSKSFEVLERLAAQLDKEGDTDRVVDAEKVAELTGVTLRTARRMLHALVEDGLAWPMPPTRSSRVGRPPRPYQLLVEKLPER